MFTGVKLTKPVVLKIAVIAAVFSLVFSLMLSRCTTSNSHTYVNDTTYDDISVTFDSSGTTYRFLYSLTSFVVLTNDNGQVVVGTYISKEDYDRYCEEYKDNQMKEDAVRGYPAISFYSRNGIHELCYIFMVTENTGILLSFVEVNDGRLVDNLLGRLTYSARTSSY